MVNTVSLRACKTEKMYRKMCTNYELTVVRLLNFELICWSGRSIPMFLLKILILFGHLLFVGMLDFFHFKD